MQKLTMLNSGPNGTYKPGQVVEVDDARAALLLDGEHAEPWVPKVEKPAPVGKQHGRRDG
jgi:hypothetical protein